MAAATIVVVCVCVGVCQAICPEHFGKIGVEHWVKKGESPTASLGHSTLYAVIPCLDDAALICGMCC